MPRVVPDVLMQTPIAGGQLSDAALLEAARAGEPRAFRKLAGRLAPRALALATRVLGDAALAEDVVQEALTRLWREAGRFDPQRGSFAGWWRRMLMNCALDGRRRLRPVASIDEVADPVDPAAGPEALAHGRGLADAVEEAAAALPPRQRAALALFYGEGCTMAEIADALETSPKAVEGLLLRGREALRARLVDMKDDWQ